MRGDGIGPRRAPETEIDASGKQRLERAELFGDDERRVIGEHDAAGADADRPRTGRDVSDDDGGGCARDAGHVVMLGEPVPVEAEALGVAREVERVAERRRRVAALCDRREIENGDQRGILLLFFAIH